ncbi:MAG: biotin--[acetyl-CoA-carboxylase] ligase [Psychroserpens sp.]|nr:biotin--[acetyl-CoA-carboxylase] ligase [Psychroserpens sp.]
MNINKLNAIDSTNSYLKQLSVGDGLDDFTVVVTEHQTQGRGQMGSVWESEHSKNLMFSVFKRFKDLKVDSHFYVSMAVSLAVCDALKLFHLKQLKIKWPNDILSEQKKICGILIENVIKQERIQSSIIGVGLNVNQVNFTNLPNAASLKQLTGIHLNTDEVLNLILTKFKYYLVLIENLQFELISDSYTSQLFRFEKPSTFRDQQGTLFTGYIKGVRSDGLLEILVEDNKTLSFDLKEVSLLY